MPTKTNFKNNFSAYYFLKVHLQNFSKIKSQKESQNSRNQSFSYYFCMVAEGSGSGAIPLTNGTGSGRPKNMWIRWIRIRIRNTGSRYWIKSSIRSMLSTTTQDIMDLKTSWTLNFVQQTLNVVYNNTGHHGSKHHGYWIWSNRRSMLSTTTQDTMDLNSMGTEFSPTDVQCCPQQYRTSWI